MSHRVKDPARVRAGEKAARTRKKRAKNAAIKKAFSKHKGSLHRMLKVPAGEKIPVRKLRWAVRQGGKIAKKAQLVLNMRAARQKKAWLKKNGLRDMSIGAARMRHFYFEGRRASF